MSFDHIPHFHHMSPEEKMTPAFALACVDYYYHNMNNKSLLAGKDIEKIDSYAEGRFDMGMFRKIFKSQRKAMENEKNPNWVKDGKNPLGIEFQPLPLLPEKLNSAESIVSKIPVEVSCMANDPLAVEKRQSDINFLKNKPLVEAEIQGVADRLGLGEVDLGTTENSSTAFSDSPFGLDLDNPDEEDIFVNLLYSLKIESAFEVGLQAFFDLTKAMHVRRMEIKDQFRYGVSVRRSFQSAFTGLPDVEYIFPGDIETPVSRLPDFSDNTHRIYTKRLTALELMDLCADEIKSLDELDDLINNPNGGYCACNNIKGKIHKNEFGTFKLTVKQFEVISVDTIGIAKSRHKKGYTTLTQDAKNSQDRICAQNTYSFFWIEKTDRVFGISRLGFSHRTRGKESLQNFSTGIYKTQEKSAVELSIGENVKAQIADIKMQHAIIKSLPAGRYIDLRFLRSAVSGLKAVPGVSTVDDLIRLALEDNVMIGDTQGFEGKNDGQFKPVMDLPGGLKSEVVGYINVIAAANAAISRITGINEQLTGQSANPEGLIGMQKLLINSSINALYYCNEALSEQDQKMFSTWANIIKQGVEEGGETKKAIVALIGSRKASVIDGLNDVRLHDIGVKIRVGQREEERALFQSQLARLVQKGALSAADEFMVNNIRNPKDQYAFLAVKEQKFKKEQQALAQQNFEQQQVMVQQQGQNLVAAKKAEAEGDVQVVYAKGDVQSKIIQLASELGLNAQKFDAVTKTMLQSDRNKAQADKNIQVLQAKSNIEQQESLV